MSHEMLYRQIPSVEKPVSRIIYGTASPPFNMGGNGNALLDGMFALGVTAIDTARVYGGSELSIGRWMAERGNRKEVVLLTKGGHPSPTGEKRIGEKAVREDLQQSLENLRTDFIDIYLLHRDDPEVPVGEIVELLNALHAEGTIGAFGGSNWTADRIREANEYAAAHQLIPFTVSSPNFGLADQMDDLWGGGSETISGPSHRADRAWYREQNMPVIAYSSLGRGLFSGRLKYVDRDRADQVLDSFALKGYGYPENYERLRRCEILAERMGVTVSQIAMAWIHAQGLNTFAVVSTGSAERMKQNIDALHLSLTQAESDYLDLIAESC